MTHFPLVKAAETGSSTKNDYNEAFPKRASQKKPHNLKTQTGGLDDEPQQPIPVQAKTGRNPKRFIR
jgi:hypothetical protein